MLTAPFEHGNSQWPLVSDWIAMMMMMLLLLLQLRLAIPIEQIAFGFMVHLQMQQGKCSALYLDGSHQQLQWWCTQFAWWLWITHNLGNCRWQFERVCNSCNYSNVSFIAVSFAQKMQKILQKISIYTKFVLFEKFCFVHIFCIVPVKVVKF